MPVMRPIEMRVAHAAAGKVDRGSGTSFAERNVSAANADGCRYSAFPEVQANAGKEFDGAVEAEGH